MSTPGFTGSHSLYRSRGRYLATHRAKGGVGATIVPQLPVIDCFWFGAQFICCDPPGSQNCTVVDVVV